MKDKYRKVSMEMGTIKGEELVKATAYEEEKQNKTKQFLVFYKKLMSIDLWEENYGLRKIKDGDRLEQDNDNNSQLIT